LSGADKAHLIQHYHSERYYRQMRRYVFARLAQLLKHAPTIEEQKHAKEHGRFVEEFPGFGQEGASGYPTRLPTAQFINEIYIQYTEQREDFCTRQMQMVHGKHLAGANLRP
jgi:hypothetical protein